VQGVMPDIVVCGKAMGNGYPLAGVITTHVLSQKFATGPAYFNTFGGGNVACASGLAVLSAIRQDSLQQNSSVLGKYLLDQLNIICDTFPDIIGNVRGRGLFIGVEIVRSRQSKHPCPGKAVFIKEHMKSQKVRALALSLQSSPQFTGG
jgi:4-aminobutyrate aminotransferase-like enzyme